MLSPPDQGHDLKLDQWHRGAAQGEQQDTQCHPCDHDNVAVSDFLDCRALQDWPRSRPPRLWEDWKDCLGYPCLCNHKPILRLVTHLELYPGKCTLLWDRIVIIHESYFNELIIEQIFERKKLHLIIEPVFPCHSWLGTAEECPNWRDDLEWKFARCFHQLVLLLEHHQHRQMTRVPEYGSWELCIKIINLMWVPSCFELNLLLFYAFNWHTQHNFNKRTNWRRKKIVKMYLICIGRNCNFQEHCVDCQNDWKSLNIILNSLNNEIKQSCLV